LKAQMDTTIGGKLEETSLEKGLKRNPKRGICHQVKGPPKGYNQRIALLGKILGGKHRQNRPVPTLKRALPRIKKWANQKEAKPGEEGVGTSLPLGPIKGLTTLLNCPRTLEEPTTTCQGWSKRPPIIRPNPTNNQPE